MRRQAPLVNATGLAGCLLCLLASGCFNPNTYTTPRTLNPGDIQFQVAPELYGGTITETVPRPGVGNAVDTTSVSFLLPTLPSFGIRYGLSDGFELGARLPNLTSLAADLKIRLLKSTVDLAIDPGAQVFYYSVGAGSANNSTVSETTFVSIFHAPLLLGVNLSDSFSIVLSPGVAYALVTGTINSGDAYQQAASSGFMLRGGLGVDVRFSKKFALHPEVTVLKGWGDTDPLLYNVGIGINFGAQPDYSDLASHEAPAGPKEAPALGGGGS
jgi:hypothetical protein